MVKIVIIDRQNSFCECIRSVLASEEDFELCGAGKDTYDALALAQKYEPDIMLIELELPNFGDMAKFNTSILARSPKARTLFITRFTDENILVNLAKTRIGGLISRHSATREIIAACRALAAGDMYVSHGIAVKSFGLFSEYVRGRQPDDKPAAEVPLSFPEYRSISLNRAESKVAVQVCRGLSNKEIAEELNLREGTVRNYVSSILKKTGLRHRTQIALRMMKGAFVDKNNSSILPPPDETAPA